MLVSLYVDDNRPLPEDEQTEVEVNGKTIKITTIGKKWSHYQSSKYKNNIQPYYLMLDENGNEVGNGSADYDNHGNVKAFKNWLEEGLKLYKAP